MFAGWGATGARAQAPGNEGQTIRDIVETARRERERRAAIQAARQDRIYTTADVVQYVPPSPETAAAPTVSDADTGIEAEIAGDESPARVPATTTAEVEWLAWQEDVVELRNEIQILDDRRVALQLQMTEIRGQVTAPTGTLQARNRALADLAVAQGTLEETTAELEESALALEELLANEPASPR
jgi:hypothetical protein